MCAVTRPEIERYLKNVVGLAPSRVRALMRLEDAFLLLAVTSYAQQRRDGK